MKPLVSIIVVNWNGGEVLKNCLASLSKIDYRNFELIIVDNGSFDNSLNIIERVNFHKLKIIKNEENLGFAPANNQGYKASKGKYILLLNNDTVVEKDFLSVLVNKMEEESDLGVIQPKIKIMGKHMFLDNAGSFLTRIGFLSHWGFMKKDSDEYDKEKEVFSTKGACMLIRRKVIEKVGLFDSDFVSYFEESDFCWRSWLIGFRAIYFPKTSILHKVGFTLKRVNVSDLNLHYYKNRIASLIKNLSFSYLVIIVPLHLFISVGISLVFLFRGHFKNSLIILNAIVWNVFNVSKTLIKRRSIQSKRVVSDKELFDKLSVAVNWSSFFNDYKRVEKDLK